MKIVCATDFTPRGQAAAQIAVDIARRTRGWVELVHVMKPGTVDILALAADAVVLEAEVRADVEARLAAECDRLSTAGVPGPVRVGEVDVVADLERALRLEVGVLPGTGRTSFAIKPAWGEPSAQILEFARGRSDDLLIVGAESRHGVGRISHPAVAERIAHEASRVPVVFVPRDERQVPE